MAAVPSSSSSSSSIEVDEAVQSRTLYVLGKEAMLRMATSNIFLTGLGGLGFEIAKNIILTGVKEFTLHDTVNTTIADLSSSCILSPADVGANRASASYPFLAELNPVVSLRVASEPLDTVDLSFFDKFNVVIMTDSPLATQVRVNEYCRAKGICFLAADVRGVFGLAFSDFGPSFTVVDPNGEELPDIYIQGISNANPGVVESIEHVLHGLETGDHVEFREIEGMTELNGRTLPVTVVNPYKFSIEDTTSYKAYVQNGIASLRKLPTTHSHRSLASNLETAAFPDFYPDWSKVDSVAAAFTGFRALDAYRQKNNGLPPAWSDAGAEAVLAEALALQPDKKGDAAFETTVRRLAFTAAGCLSPLAEFLGGFVAQEALKALTQKYTPLKQVLVLDAVEVMPELNVERALVAPRGDRYDGLRICVGQELLERLANQRAFMVGAGAIGCEMIKNLALLGVGTGPQGRVYITDNDVIEVSNLSRQFLFRRADVTKPKSECATRAALAMNPDMKIEAHLNRVGKDSEGIYTPEFFNELNVVINALDNVEARLYVDGRCVAAQRPLLESGTLATKGHVQVIVPHMTESYGSQADPPEKDVPFCTIKSFPYEIQHTIQFARDKFAELFSNVPGEVNKFFSYTAGPIEDQLGPTLIDGVKNGVSALAIRPTSYSDCVAFARQQFQRYFHDSIIQLLDAYPLDSKLKNGTLFWSNPKRPPTPMIFDASDPLHMSFIVHTSRLWANVWGIPSQHHDTPLILEALAATVVRPFVPKASVKVDDEGKVPIKDDEGLVPDFAAATETVRKAVTEGGLRVTTNPEEFEKDDATNSHIAFIAATSNLRARNYTIAEADELKTKRIAGKIMPAISTTTAAVSGWVTLELIKIVKGLKVEAYRNLFLNLGIALIAAIEPGAAVKRKITNDVSVTLWDTWDVSENDGKTLKDFMDVFMNRYGLTVNSVSKGPTTIYLAAMPNHKKKLKDSMRALLKLDGTPAFVPLTLSFADAAGEPVDGPAVRFFLA